MSNDTRSFFPLYRQTGYAAGSRTFDGQNAASVTVAASNGAAVASTVFEGTTNNNDTQIMVSNTTSVWVMVNFGVLLGGQTVRAATITDIPVPPGVQQVFTVDPEVNAASVFANGAPAASTSVIFTRGSGT